MSGIYLHIPFCKQACYYCDFHFSTNRRKQAEMVEAISAELAQQKDYLKTAVQTIYFGGGTPSLLSPTELEALLNTVNKNFDVEKCAEITLEANPEDLQQTNFPAALLELGINRLSIGIQSFYAPHLQYMHRAHSPEDACRAVRNAQKVGFKQITIDLIYGIKADNHSIWINDLQTAIGLDVPHISAYCLTIEDKTVFGNWLKRGKIKAVEDDFSAEQFEILLESMEKSGYAHYEISNFARKGSRAVHNRNYWKQVPYLGVGPGAHSFNGTSRQFNVRNNNIYLREMKQKKIPFQKEILTKTDFINEYVMTSLRTSEGCDLTFLHKKYDYDLKKTQNKTLEKMRRSKLIIEENEKIKLSKKGKLLADHIAAELFLV